MLALHLLFGVCATLASGGAVPPPSPISVAVAPQPSADMSIFARVGIVAVHQSVYDKEWEQHPTGPIGFQTPSSFPAGTTLSSVPGNIAEQELYFTVTGSRTFIPDVHKFSLSYGNAALVNCTISGTMDPERDYAQFYVANHPSYLWPCDTTVDNKPAAHRGGITITCNAPPTCKDIGVGNVEPKPWVP